MDGPRYLEDGKLTIFRRWGTYYARIRTSASDKYIVRSLKTTIEQTAIKLAAGFCSKSNSAASKACRQNRKNFQKSSTTTFATSMQH
jgi:hypothetical protein